MTSEIGNVRETQVLSLYCTRQITDALAKRQDGRAASFFVQPQRLEGLLPWLSDT